MQNRIVGVHLRDKFITEIKNNHFEGNPIELFIDEDK